MSKFTILQACVLGMAWSHAAVAAVPAMALDGAPGETAWHALVWVLLAVGSVVASALFILGYFNRRLRRAVDQKTQQLVLANDALFRHTTNLVEKERALFLLNQELEQRVAERTQALTDINATLQREIEDRARRELSLRLLSNAVESCRSGIIVADVTGVVVYVNAAFLDLVGLTRDQVCHKPLSALQPRLELPDLALSSSESNTPSLLRSELECFGANNSRAWVQVSVSGIQDGQGQRTHYVIACEDITLLKQNRDEMERLAFYDSLTGLENRLLFKLRLEKAVANAQREKVRTALMFIDIDHFKQINDTFGHDAGDEVLQAVAARIRQSVRNNDTVARVSGDEFTVLLGGVHSNEDVRRVAQGILKTLSQPVKLAGNEYFVSASIGISVTPGDGTGVDELMKNADLAMYEAKRNGRNNFQFFSKRLNEEAKRNLDLEQELRAALADRHFFIAYQPRICLKTMRLAGVEALVRWRHIELGTLYPEYFLGFAEDSGFIVELGKWVLSECSLSARILRDAGFSEARLSVNVSARQLRDRSLLEDVAYLFGHGDNVISNVELEITEASLIENHSDSLQTIEELRSMGFTLSIDDFGTGYSALNHLKRLPVDFVKIDRSQVEGLPTDASSAETVRAVIGMAHGLNQRVVAEGVESPAQVEFLKDLGCDYAQGYFFGQAMPLRELMRRYEPLRGTGNAQPVAGLPAESLPAESSPGVVREQPCASEQRG